MPSKKTRFHAAEKCTIRSVFADNVEELLKQKQKQLEVLEREIEEIRAHCNHTNSTGISTLVEIETSDFEGGIYIIHICEVCEKLKLYK